MSGYDNVHKLITHTGNTNNWSRKKSVAETSQTNILALCRVSTTKAQPVTMIDKSEINKTGKFFSQPFLLCPAGFLKNQLPLSPYHYFENSIVHSEKEQGNSKLCQFVKIHSSSNINGGIRAVLFLL